MLIFLYRGSCKLCFAKFGCPLVVSNKNFKKILLLTLEVTYEIIIKIKIFNKTSFIKFLFFALYYFWLPSAPMVLGIPLVVLKIKL